jgi:predicted TIM-barrel fold metal-dependent hydrolase
MSPERWGERIPHVVKREDGTEVWAFDGLSMPLTGWGSIGALLADRASEPKTWDEVPAAAYQAKARLASLDADGIDCSVLYPSVAGLAGEMFGQLTDPGLELACVQAYNDWLIEEWAAVSPRFLAQCLVPLSPERAPKEIERAVGRGHRGVLFPSIPLHLRSELPHINDQSWDPIWAACQDSGVPLCLHAGASGGIQFTNYDHLAPKLASALAAITRPTSSVQVVSNMLYSRILDRFPRLKVVFAESGISWTSYELEMADHEFERQRMHLEGYDRLPSQIFHEQCYVTGWYDQARLAAFPYIGPANIMWGTNFPQATSSWPSTQTAVSRCLDGLPAEDQTRILSTNAAGLYRV